MAAELAGRGVVVQVNTEENPLLSARFGIRGIPATILLEKGKVVGRLEGAREKASLLDWFRNSLK